MDRPPSFIVEASREGLPTLAVPRGGSRTYLHSRISPSREGSSLEAEFHPERYDVLVVLGVGLGYHLLPLTAEGINYRRILLIDILPGIENEIARNPLTSFLNGPKTRLLSGASSEEIEGILFDLLDTGVERGIQVIEHPPSIRLFPEYYGRVKEIVQRAVDRFGGNRATKAAFGPRYLRNAILNLTAIDRFVPVSSLFGRLSGLPGVVVTSGPTLDGVVPHLRKARSRVVVLAVDSAVSSLSAAGIIPDLAVSIDPQQHVLEHFAHAWPDSLATVFSTTSYPLAPRRRAGYISLNSHPASQLLDELRPGSIGSIDSLTGTVAGDALLLAHRLGLSPIALAGFDFCFTDHAIYARNSAYQRRFALYFQNRFHPVESQNLSYIFKSSGGHLVDGRFSRRSFEAYRSSIESLLRRESIRNIHRLEPTGVRLQGADELSAERFFEGIQHSIAIEAVPALPLPTPIKPERPFFGDLREVLSEDDVLGRLITASLGEGAPRAVVESARRKMTHMLEMEKKE